MQPQIKRVRPDPTVAVAVVCQLFRLPRELLELVAGYFSRSEAVPVLTVNSALHEIFAERIWRRLSTYHINGVNIPLESFLRYGHLMRHMRITTSVLDSIDLAAAFPNITHLWIPLTRLADTIKSSHGTCFERLSFLGTWAASFRYSTPGAADSIDSVLNWLDSRFKAEAGLEKVEWKMYEGQPMQLMYDVLKWFQCNDQLSRFQFKFNGESLDFNDAEHADFNKIIAQRLVDWKIDGNDECAAEKFSRLLVSIPPAERQHFAFPVLKRLEIGICCYVGNDVYSRFNFGVMFPSVWDLTLDTTISYCEGRSGDAFDMVLAHPWPSVRKLDLYGDIDFESIISLLASVPNVEELIMGQDIDDDDDDDDEGLGEVDLCELSRTLPKLVRLQVSGFSTVSASQQQQHSQQQQLFRQLRHVSLQSMTVKSSAISALVHAPVLTDICLKYVKFGNGDDADNSGEDEDEDEYGSNHRMDSAHNLDFLSDVTNTTVRFVDIYVESEHVSAEYEDTIRALLKCFVRLAACDIRSTDEVVMPNLHEVFPNVKFKYFS
ncbi:hypothetical protein GQ42DRAFT_160508 [Ramicandelaber brevisporus]|nr:hypothetical protein GQ42DRAFT_160508 [Ramicandelaber brevisporus]